MEMAKSYTDSIKYYNEITYQTLENLLAYY